MGGSTITTKAERINSVQLQQSSLGQPNPLFFGKCRVPTNLLWYGDFKSVAVTTTTRSGKGGGVTQKDTKYEYYVAFQAAFGDGVVPAVSTVWVGKQKYTGTTAYSGNATVTELAAVPANGKVKMSVWARLVSVQNLWVCQGVGEVADTLLTAGTHYSVSGGIITLDVGTYPQYSGRVLRVAYTYDQTGLQSALTAAGIPFFATGGIGQAVYSHMSTNHPTQALPYSETALIGANAYRLDDSAQLPNHNFECVGRMQYPGKDDALPSDIVSTILTHPSSGATFPSDRVSGLEAYEAYCRAYNLFLSPAYTEQREARLIIDELMAMTNSAVVYSEGVLKIKPYGTEAKTGNGATYTPSLTPIYDLTDDDFVVSGTESPVKQRRKTPADAFNSVSIEILNRARDYNTEPVPATDSASIEIYGPRPKDPVAMHGICDLTVARAAAQLLLQRELYIRSTYTFKLDWRYCLLEPMDLVTLTDVGLNLVKTPVLITSVEEGKDGLLTFEAEDFPAGIATATLYPSQGGTGYLPDYEVSPGNVQAPVFFEPPIELGGETGLEVWAAVTGVDPNWGGCTVWASYDGASYSKIGVLNGGARYGTITNTITSAVGQVANVQLAGLGGTIVNATSVDSSNQATLSLIGDEFVGYANAALTGANAYDLTLANRSFYNSGAVGHSSPERYVRVDERMMRSGALAYSMIGQTIHFKFTSFNIYQAAEQSLVDVADYTYTVRGNMVAIPPNNVIAGSYALEGYGVRLRWTKVADQDVDVYEIRVGGTNWSDATVVAQVKGDNYLWAVQTAGTYTVRIRALDVLGNYSPADFVESVVIAAPTTTSLVTSIANQDVVLDWSIVTGAFAIVRYEIRYGSTWAGGTAVAVAYTNNYKEKVEYGGTRTYWVAAVDAAGNYSTPVSADMVIANPLDVFATAEVIDNNVLLRWLDCTTSLPVVAYTIRRGASWAAGVEIGEGGTALFAPFFEQVGGTYTYWIQARDSAGNVGTPTSISAVVNQPPDYVLRLDYNSDFSGTKSNVLFQSGEMFAVLDTTETWTDHFVDNSWTNPQDQVTAGYPNYFEPSATSGYYEETIDYGSTLPATGIALTITYVTEKGTVTVTPQISVKLNIGDAWTDFAGQSQVVTTNFRYVKIRYDFASSGGNDLIRITNINLKLSAKQRTDSGMGTAASGDSGGTTVTFNINFIDVTSITVTPSGTTARYALYDFTDTPNPTTFKVLLFDSAGARASGDFSWSARGI